MDDEKIKARVQQAINALKDETPRLTFGDVTERATAHRLAVHLEPQFPGWNIDCEYNLDEQTLKLLHGIRACDHDRTTDRVFPDIIIHHRAQSGRDNNLLVVELKRKSARDACDKMRLELFTCTDANTQDRYKYQLGLYININAGNFACTWYKNGRQEGGSS